MILASLAGCHRGAIFLYRASVTGCLRVAIFLYLASVMGCLRVAIFLYLASVTGCLRVACLNGLAQPPMRPGGTGRTIAPDFNPGERWTTRAGVPQGPHEIAGGGRTVRFFHLTMNEALNYAICDIRDNYEAYTNHFIRR
jgi:hypothetical protein